MSRILNNNRWVAALSVLILLFAGCVRKKEQKAGNDAVKYTCPMHHEIIRDARGECPICGMDLVPVQRPSRNAPSTVQNDLKDLLKPTDEVVVSGIRTVYPLQAKHNEELILRGVVNYNTRNLNIISSRISGRIEKLYIRYNFQPVQKGQKLMEIYSPDLVNAQQELLFLKSNGEPALLEAAKQKLRLLGATELQIRQVLKTGRASNLFTVYSPYPGYITEQPGASQNPASGVPGSTMITSTTEQAAGSSMNGPMGGGGSAGTPSVPAVAAASPLTIREGQYISAGQTLFSVFNDAELWAEFYAGNEQLSGLKKGTAVRVEATDIPGQHINTMISLVQPYYQGGRNFPLVRAAIPNVTRRWKVGQLINVKAPGRETPGTWLPRTAVLQLGTRYVAFVKDGGVFVPKYVKVSARANGWLNIGSSLSTNAEVAKNAWFLVDSESFVKVED